MKTRKLVANLLVSSTILLGAVQSAEASLSRKACTNRYAAYTVQVLQKSFKREARKVARTSAEKKAVRDTNKALNDYRRNKVGNMRVTKNNLVGCINKYGEAGFISTSNSVSASFAPKLQKIINILSK